MKTLLAGLIMIAGLASAEEVKTDICDDVFFTPWHTNWLTCLTNTTTGDYGSVTNYPVYSIHEMQEKGVITTVINELAKAGEICKVFGHQYPNVWIGDRECPICGKIWSRDD